MGSNCPELFVSWRCIASSRYGGVMENCSVSVLDLLKLSNNANHGGIEVEHADGVTTCG